MFYLASRSSRSLLAVSLVSAFTPICLGIAKFQRSLAIMAGRETSWTLNKNMAGTIHIFPMFDSNYGYFLSDGLSNRVACVDPGDGEAAYNWAKKLNLDLTTLLCTHKHADHVGGNLFLKSAIHGLEIIGTKYEPIPGVTKEVGDGDVFQFESLKITTMFTPCHTSGHVLYFVESTAGDNSLSPLLFSGDTLFVGGCGRFFEGTGDDMLKNMDRLATLPTNTHVFCAHEYTESNFKFLAYIDEERCQGRYGEIQATRAKDIPTVPTTIGEELQYNLFMNCRDSRLQQLLSVSSPVQAMTKLREMKNNF